MITHFGKIDEKLELLKKSFEHNQEFNNEKFEQRLEENAKEIQSIKKMMAEMRAILSGNKQNTNL